MLILSDIIKCLIPWWNTTHYFDFFICEKIVVVTIIQKLRMRSITDVTRYKFQINHCYYLLYFMDKIL